MNTDRIEQIQKGTAYPESKSVQQALLEVWNECSQRFKDKISDPDIGISQIIDEFDKLKKAIGVDVYRSDDKWDIRFIEMAKFISEWSKDPSTQVGAVIVDAFKRVISVGFNGYPQNIPDDDLHDRERKYAKIIHAEMNAILFSKRDISGCTIYVYPMPPCSQCASALIQSGIGRIVTRKATSEQYERWGDKIELTEEMLKSANITLDYI